MTQHGGVLLPTKKVFSENKMVDDSNSSDKLKSTNIVCNDNEAQLEPAGRKIIDENTPNSVNIHERKNSDLRPNNQKPLPSGARPPRVGGSNKYKNLKSTGYGRRNTADASPRNFNDDDNSSIGSASSFRSASSQGQKTGHVQSRVVRSVPSSPVGSNMNSRRTYHTRLQRSNSNNSISSCNARPSTEKSEWARQERERQSQRKQRSGLTPRNTSKTSNENKRKLTPINTDLSPAKLEHAACSLFETSEVIELLAKNSTQLPDSKDNKSSDLKAMGSKFKVAKQKLQKKFFGPQCQNVEKNNSKSDVNEISSSCADFEETIIRDALNEIFAYGTGISQSEINDLMDKKIIKRTWDTKKKYEAQQKIIKELKDVLKAFCAANNDFATTALEFEDLIITQLRSLKKQKVKTDKVHSELEATIASLKSKLLELTQRESAKEGKIKAFEQEILSLKQSLLHSEKKHEDAKISLVDTEGQLKESRKQSEGLRSEIALIEAAKASAVKKAETAITSSLEREIVELRDECSALKACEAMRNEELYRLVNIDGNKKPQLSIVDAIKRELDRLREKIAEKEGLLAVRETEHNRALLDCEAMESRLQAKEKDMSEIVRTFKDFQQSGKSREDELKLQLKVCERRNTELENQLLECRSEVSALSHENSSIKETLESVKRDYEELIQYKEECNAYKAAVDTEKQLRARAEEKEREERNERVACSSQMLAMTKEHCETEAKLKEANESLDRMWRERFNLQKSRLERREVELQESKESVTGLEAQKDNLVAALNDKKSMADAKSIEEIGRLNGEMNVMKERLRLADQKASVEGLASTETIQSLKQQLQDSRAERRRMHNLIQELRGNIRVYVRIRPFLPADRVAEDMEPCAVPKNENSLRMMRDGDSTHDFSFDRVFPPSASQQAIFQEVSELVQSALDGYSVCLFSYGQTGSGKTHTMQGSGTGQMRGIIPRAIEQVGKYKSTLELDGWKYEMKVSFLEIYNEIVRDLLREEDSKEIKHEIKIDGKGKRFVSGLTMMPLEPSNFEQIEEIMRLASKHRSVASTDMNNVSSRSHSVFTLHLTATHVKMGQALSGTLNLVDLAGSERLHRSGAIGHRAKEAMAINKSLSSLTDVFVAISKKSSHIPFRNSKLTYLLQPSLSGDGKTLMIVNVSPTEESFQESTCALKFASNVNKCELGKPKRSIEDVNNVCEQMGRKFGQQRKNS